MKKSIFNKEAGVWAALAILVFVLILIAYLTDLVTPFYEITLINIGINIILAVSLNLIIGFAGQFSLGHAGFMAVGAYASAIITQYYPGTGGMFLGMLAGMVVSGLIALLVGIPTLRLKGDYLAIATLGVSEIIRILILNMEITNGAAGISGIPRNVNWITVYVFILITTIVVTNYIHSSPGRATIAVREDEIAASSVGVNTTKHKIIAFVIGAIFASIAGTLYASYFTVINPNQFTFQKSIDILIIVVFGGMGSITGSFVGAIILGLLNTVLQSFGQWRMIIYALAIIFIMIYRPSGLLGNMELSARSWLKRRKGKGEDEK